MPSLSGEPPEVAPAIEEHYLPRFVGDASRSRCPACWWAWPTAWIPWSACSRWAFGPSGAADPWGLRRAALGLVQLLMGREYLAGPARGHVPGRRAVAR